MRWTRRSRLLAGIVLCAVAAAVVAAVVVFATPGAPPHAPPHTPPRSPGAGPSATGSSSRTSTTQGSFSSTASSTSAATKPEPHVMVVVMENHGYDTIVGTPSAPYLNSLVARYGLATASFATAHPSLPNYLELVSGSTQGVVDDCTTCMANGSQVVDQLEQRGIGWQAFMEGAPSACFTGFALPFDRHHDPFVYAPHIVEDSAECDRVVPFTTFPVELARGDLPPFVWVTPDVEHDMHTGSVTTGDTWLRQTLTPVLASSWYRDDGAVIITFDESSGSTDAGCCTGADGGHIMTLVVSERSARAARLTTPVDDAGVLRTIETLYRLPYLGAAAAPQSGTLLPLLGMPNARAN